MNKRLIAKELIKIARNLMAEEKKELINADKLTGDTSHIWGNASNIEGEVSHLRGDMTGKSGDTRNLK